jgi:VanZ family protein
MPPRRTQNAAVAHAGGLAFPEPGLARTRAAPDWLHRAMQLGAVRVELRLRTYSPEQHDAARIFTVSRDYHFRNLTVDQEGPDLLLRLRRPGSTQNGKPSYRIAGTLADTGWRNVAIAITPGRLEVMVDGRLALSDALTQRPLADWDRRYRVALGNEHNGNRPWRGEIAAAVVTVGAERIDYARPGLLELPERYWAIGNKPVWLVEDYVYPDSIRDWLANFVAFVPLGFLLATLRGRRPSWWRALVVCALLSLVVEVAQGFFSRHPSTLDWVLNTLGGGAGAAMAQWLNHRASRRRRGVPSSPVPGVAAPTC